MTPHNQRLHDSISYEPTPEQIAEATAEIRKGWSVQVERARRGEPEKRYVEVAESIMPEGVTEREVMW